MCVLFLEWFDFHDHQIKHGLGQFQYHDLTHKRIKCTKTLFSPTVRSPFVCVCHYAHVEFQYTINFNAEVVENWGPAFR